MMTIFSYQKVSFLAFALLMFPFFGNAQLNKQWQVNLPLNDFTYIKGDKLQFDETGKIYTFTRYISGFQQYQTTKLDVNGNILWSKNATSGNEHYFPSEMIVNGTAYVVGSTQTDPPYAYLVNYKPAGGLKFDSYNTNYSAPRMTKDPSGNLVVSGIVSVGGAEPIRLIKYAADGTQVWQNDFYPGVEGTAYNNLLNVTSDNAGNFYVAASHIESNPLPDPSFYTIRILKVDENGNLIWVKIVESTEVGSFSPTDMQYNSSDNSVYIVYEFNSLTVPCLDKMSKVTSDGELSWTKSRPGNQGGGDNRVRIGQDGSIYWWQNGGSIGSFYGYSYAGGTSYQGAILKYDKDGTEQWACSGSAFTIDAAGNVYTIYAGQNFGPVLHIQKYDPSGVLLWDEPDNTSNNYSYGFLDVYCDDGNNLYAMAGSANISTTIVKYDISCGYNKAPAKPAGIDGPFTNVCTGINHDYSCPPVNKATHYYWYIPEGAYITGQGTNAVSVSFPAGFTSGTISVYASNCLGASKPRSITVYGIPGKPGAITGATAVCANQTDVIYSVSPVPGANDYTWKVPVGAVITSGQGTNAITVNYGSSGGNIKVKSNSDCGSSEYKKIQVNMTCRENEATAITVDVFPNPAADAFIIRTNQEFKELRVKDLSGKIIAVMPFANDMMFGSELSDGIYLVELINEKSALTRSVIKLH